VLAVTDKSNLATRGRLRCQGIRRRVRCRLLNTPKRGYTYISANVAPP